MIKRRRRPQAVPHQVRADKAFRVCAYLLALTIVISSIAYLLNTTEPANAETRLIVASMDGFSQNEVQVKRGVPVTIRLISVDSGASVEHQWAVDELGLNLLVPPLGTNALTFTPEMPGVYTFYCDTCCGGREAPSMQGTLVVTA